MKKFLQFGQKSLIDEMILKLKEEDPDFGKANNEDPNNEFAFELRVNPAVPTILEMSEGLREHQIFALSDYGDPIEAIPIGATSKAFFFDLVSHSIELKTHVASLPLQDCMHALSRGIVECIDGLDLPERKKNKLKLLRMSRFYYRSPDSWWNFTHS